MRFLKKAMIGAAMAGALAASPVAAGAATSHNPAPERPAVEQQGPQHSVHWTQCAHGQCISYLNSQEECNDSRHWRILSGGAHDVSACKKASWDTYTWHYSYRPI